MIVKMGNTVKKYKTFISLSHRRDIISEKSLRSVALVTNYLKLNVHNREVFRDTSYRRKIRQIATFIATGSNGIETILMESTPSEVAAGLQYFLVRMPKSVLPPYIQALALDAGNQIRPETVAADILGLISQDMKGRHLILIAILLDLLNFIRKHAASDELAGSSVPIVMLPVFIQLQPHHMPKMRNIATIFMEIVNLSPNYIPLSDRRMRMLNSNIFERDIRNQNVINNHFDQENVINSDDLQDGVLHQLLVRNGSEGDAQFPEIVRITQNQSLPIMINPVFGYYTRRFR